MNVQFKTMRKSGDKAYILSEITGYDEHLPVVLSASTESGARVPSDAFPFCDDADPLAVESVLADAALASYGETHTAPHTKNTAGVRFFVVVLPWMKIRRWILEFKAIDALGNTLAACTKKVDLEQVKWTSRFDARINQAQGNLIEKLDGRFIHDRIHISFVRAFEWDENYMVSALLELPYHKESNLEFDFLNNRGQALTLDSFVIEDSVTPAADHGVFERRYVMISFLVGKDKLEVCLCATDTTGSVAPGFAMLGKASLEELLANFKEITTDAFCDETYHQWFEHTSKPDVPTLLEQVSLRFEHAPLISVVCPVIDTPAHHLYDLVSSMLMQSYGKWELILVSGTSENGFVADAIASLEDDRVYVLEVEDSFGLPNRINAGLQAAEGEFMGVFRANNKMAPNALFELVRMINEQVEGDVIYSDSDLFDADGTHSCPCFRPDFSPELLRSYNYVDEFYLVRSSLAYSIGLLDEAYRGALLYDWLLRACEKARRVCHVPRVLYHVRNLSFIDTTQETPEFIVEAGRRAVVAHCQRVGIRAEVLILPSGGYQIRHVLAENPHVVVVVPTENNPQVLSQCVRSLYQNIHYKNFEVVAVSVGEAKPETQEVYDALKARYETFSVLSWGEEFNHARIANYAASQTAGEFLLFISDDTKVITTDALQAMLGYFQSEEVGVVGPRQLFIDGTIEHAGIVLGGKRVITPLFRYLPTQRKGYMKRSALAQNISAVAGDCMMVRRAAFEAVGGFSEGFTLYYSDVDFCLKAKSKGYYTVYTPHVDLSHFQSVSRIRNYSKTLRIQKRREAALLQYYWPRAFVEGDAFYNPNLDPDNSYFALRSVES